MSFEIIMTTSVTRSFFTKQYQTCKTKTTTYKTKTNTDFFGPVYRTGSLRPHHWAYVWGSQKFANAAWGLQSEMDGVVVHRNTILPTRACATMPN